MLREGLAFTVVEFGADGITAWEIARDRNGTPKARHWPAVRPALSDDPGVLYDRKLSWLTSAGSRLLLVSSSPDELYATVFDVVRSARPDAPIYYSAIPLAEVLREIIAGTPLTHWYKLVVLRPTRSGRLVFESCQLFPPDAAHGYQHQFQIRCEPSDEHGTVFAVVAEGARNSFRLVSLRSASLDPGVYEPTATLLRPGQVDFQGLPGKLRAEHRSWPELVRAVPARLDRPPPAHLICTVDISGTADQLLRRIDRLEQLVSCADAADTRVRVSLISYGPHSFDRAVPDEPATVLAWAEASKTVLTALAKLGKRRPREDEYPRASQLECALTEVAGLICNRPQDGRPILVTVGFPAAVSGPDGLAYRDPPLPPPPQLARRPGRNAADPAHDVRCPLRPGHQHGDLARARPGRARAHGRRRRAQLRG